MDQPHSQRGLQPRHPPRDSGLGHTQPLRCPGEPLRVNHGHKGLDLVELGSKSRRVLRLRLHRLHLARFGKRSKGSRDQTTLRNS